MIFHVARVFFSKIREKTKGLRRSSGWHLIREEHLKNHDFCAACMSKKHLQVHHIVPFHLDPSKELDKTNLITLCMGSKECHLKVGHLGSWRGFNPNVVEDAKKLYRNN